MTIGLIVSSKLEAKILLRHLPEAKKLKIEQFEVHYSKVDAHEVFIILCDRDIQSTRVATSLLIQKVSPALLISYGTAGTLDTEVRPGDVIYASAVTILENDVFEQYIALSTTFGKVRNFILQVILNNQRRFFVGTFISISTPAILHFSEKIKFLHPVLDLETIAIAQLSKQKHIPLFALKGITHSISPQQINSLSNILGYYRHFNSYNALLKLLLRPWILLLLPIYFKNKVVAANNAASILVSLIHELIPEAGVAADDYQI
jgi:nucleoside phosphorylase